MIPSIFTITDTTSRSLVDAGNIPRGLICYGGRWFANAADGEFRERRSIHVGMEFDSYIGRSAGAHTGIESDGVE